MKRALEFLKECRTFYVATVEGDQPRVRPFGAVCEYQGRLYIVTNNQKAVFKQILANPKIEICGVAPDRRWIRIAAEAVVDPDREAKAEMLRVNPVLNTMFSLDDGICEVLYLKNATATIYSFTAAPETFTF